MTNDTHDKAVEAVASFCPLCEAEARMSKSMPHYHVTEYFEGHERDHVLCKRFIPSESPTPAERPVSVADGWKRTESFSVAVYWPDEGSYGIPTSCKSMAEAENRAEADWALGYGCGAKNSGLIHIIKTVREVREWKGAP